MTISSFELLYLPVAVWVATGFGLWLSVRRSGGTIVLRLAAAFVALWALLATTVLAWVVANGGWSAVVALAESPLLLFTPGSANLWLLGAAGAFAVFAVAFVLNQLAGWGILSLLRPIPLSWPRRFPRPTSHTSLGVFSSPRLEAFSFTLLELALDKFPWVRRHEVVLLSDELVRRLEPAEVDSVIAHELGHVTDLDGRYLTFMRTLARMMRWDPVLAYLASSLTTEEEFRADDAAVRLTGDPVSLARALFKANRLDAREAGGMAGAFLGPGGPRGRRLTVARIRRLLALAETSRFPTSPNE